MKNYVELEKWEEYQQQTSGGKPRTLLVKAIKYVSMRDAALDLGAGALNETQHLLDNGFKNVIAVDITPQFKNVSIKEGVHFEYCESSFEEYHFQPQYFDLISSQFAIPFAEKNQFPEIWRNITQSLKQGGVFCGQLFGKKDDWGNSGTVTTHTSEEVSKMTENFEVLYLEEIENDSKTASGQQKHWHYFELILRKK